MGSLVEDLHTNSTVAVKLYFFTVTQDGRYLRGLTWGISERAPTYHVIESSHGKFKYQFHQPYVEVGMYLVNFL